MTNDVSITAHSLHDTKTKLSMRYKRARNGRFSFCLFFFQTQITTRCEIATSSIYLIPVSFSLSLSLLRHYLYVNVFSIISDRVFLTNLILDLP